MLDTMTSYSALGPKQQILDALEREYARTKRVLRAYPDDQPPETVAAMVEALEREHKQVVDTLRPLDEATLATETVRFFVAPKTLGDIPKIEFLWFLLFDHVHHRGQFSIYLRMADAKVPSIYGPSADEPWR
jgi:uncharacterized damage-inducible protein DinB